MKKKLVTCILAAAMVAAAVPITQIPAQASTNVNSYIDADILTDSSIITDNLERNSSKWYVYYMPETRGHVNFSLTNPDALKKFRLTVYDSQAQKIKQFPSGSTVQTTEYAFAPYTAVYIQVYNPYGGNKLSTEYSLSANFTAASDWENDDTNDDMMLADTLIDATPEYGVIYSSKDTDYYSFSMPSDGKVAFTIQNFDSVSGAQWRLRIYDENQKQVYNKYVKSGDFSLTSDEISGDSGSKLYASVSSGGSSKAVGTTYAITPYFTQVQKETPKPSADNNSGKSTGRNNNDTTTPQKPDNSTTPSVPDATPQNPDTTKTDDTVAIPERVSGLSLKNIKGSKVKVSFSDIENASGYQVWYSYSGRIKRKMVYDSASTKLSIPKKKKVTVKVRAFNYDNNDQKQYGSWSATKILKTDKK